MKKCPKCQHANSNQAKFCSNCGTRFSLNCTHCDAENDPEAKFCHQCGNNLMKGHAEKTGQDQKSSAKGRKEAERRQLTILFCDLVGSTPLSEKLDPEDYRQVITNYHQVAEKVIRKNGGHVAQYLGDGLLVYFGYPEGLEDAPRAGVRTGLGILKAMAASNKEWKSAGKTEVNVRIGIHTGLVVVDDHLALGEAVNIAARLEGLAPENGIVLSPQVHNLVYGWFEVNNIGKHTLKGISEPMDIYQVLHESGAITRLDVAKSKGLSPLVGRRNELDILMEYWDKAKKGNSNLVLLHGEAGIGKSRLVDTMEVKVAKDPDGNLAVARGSAYQQNSAFFPISAMIEEYIFHFTDGDIPADKLDKLDRYLKGTSLDFDTALPLLAEFLSIPSEKHPPLIISPFAKRQKTLDILMQLMLYQAQLKPLLLVIEDLHWADASTLEWLNMFKDNLEGKNLLVLCTTRPGLKAEWQDHADVTKINLQRLASQDMVEICHHQTKGKALPEEILNQIATKTEGVPLFVEELTKTIIESDLLVEKSDGFEVAGPVSSLAIPSTLQDSLLARLDRLDEVKEIVQIGSVLGREFSIDMLNAVLQDKIDNLELSMHKLLDSEIFYQGGTDEQKVYQFKHALIQDAAYESLLKSRRQQMHQQVATVLENKFKETIQTQPELLAHHYTEARQPGLAIPIWLKAGQQASSKNATAEAISHLEMGLGLLHHVKIESDRNNYELDFLLTLGGTFMVSHGFPHPKVKETFNRALSIAKSMEISPKLAFILMGLGGYYFNREDWEAYKETREYLLQLAEDPDQGYWFELVCRQINGGASIVQGNFVFANSEYKRVLEIFDPSLPFPWEISPSGYLEIAAKAWWMFCLHVLGHLDQAKNLSEQHLSYEKQHKDSSSLYHIHTFIALYNMEAREWELAEKILDKYLPIVREFGDPIFILTAEVYHYVSRAYQGDREAFKTAINLFRVCVDVGFNAFASLGSSFIAELFFLFQDYDGALAWIEKTLDRINKSGSHCHTTELFRIKGLTLQALGKPKNEVENYFIEAIELAKKQDAKTLELRSACELAKLWGKQGKTKEAYNLLQEVYEWFTEGHDSVDLKEAKATLDELKI
jgi:class 3 adenylate cyclase/tetratricopeptide (TPR) repeat protein